MSVYTKTGDQGETRLVSGERVPKESLRVSAYGTVDEANAVLGIARSLSCSDDVKSRILAIQKKLPLLMADIASIGGQGYIKRDDVEGIEKSIDEVENALPPLSSFIIPGGSQAGAMLDMARTVVRRAERKYITLSRREEINDCVSLYLNRLSDYCFELERLEEKDL